jgi:hypothetical protein
LDPRSFDVFHRLAKVSAFDHCPVEHGPQAPDLGIETFGEPTERVTGTAQLSILFL